MGNARRFGADTTSSSQAATGAAVQASSGGPMSAWPSAEGGGFDAGAAAASPAVQLHPAALQFNGRSAAEIIAMARSTYGRYRNLESAVTNLREAADEMREAGTHWYGDDDNLIAGARSLTSAANKISSAGGQLQEFSGRMQNMDFDGLSANLDRVETALQAADLFAAFMDDSTMEAFHNDPTTANANAWANHVTGLFTRASDLFPEDIPGLPSFIPGMIKGYLRAPAAYVSAFQGIMSEYTARIDSAAGFSNARAKVVDGNDVLWEGEMSHLWWMAPSDLQGFMRRNRDEDGIDLYECSRAGGISHLLFLIDQDYELDSDTVERWMAHIARYQ